MSTASRIAARARSRRAQWWISFALFTLLAATWSLANPIYAAPDEPVHVIRAASVGGGELIGQTRPGHPDHVRWVEAPVRFRLAASASHCFFHQPDQTADCAPSFESWPADLERIGVVVGRYPPTPFLVAAPPATLGLYSSTGVYLMRVLGAAVCGALFASALASLRAARQPWLAMCGLAFALTPMVFFTASAVNPSNLEIAGGVGAWASGLVLAAKAREGVVDTRVVARAAIAAVVLVLARPLGMLWLGLAAVVVLLTCTKPAFLLLLRSRAVQVWGAIVAAAIVFELGWIVVTDTLGSKVPPGESAEGLSNLQVLQRTFGATDTSYGQMVGVFGWLDTPVPSLTLVLWTAALGALVLLGAGLTSRRLAGLIAATLALAVVVPAVLEFIEARRFGFGWQGRYTLPFAVGLPILAGFALAQQPSPVLARARLAAVFAGAFVVAQFLAFGQNLRRYTVGERGSFMFWLDAEWSPPVPSSLLLVAYAALLVALALWLWHPAVCAEVPTGRPVRAQTETAAVPR